MNKLIIAAFVLGGLTIAIDHLVYSLPDWLAVPLFTIAVILFVTGIYKSTKEKTDRQSL